MLSTSRTTSFIASRVFLNAGLSLHFPATGHDDCLFAARWSYTMACFNFWRINTIAHFLKKFSAVFFQRTIGHSLWNAKTFTFGVLLITPRFSFSLNHLVMQNVDLLYDSKFSFKFGDVFSQFREVFFNTSQILITFILIIKSKFNNLFHGKLFMSRLFYAISIKKQACVTY